jgi:hypothetical protein
MNGGTVGGISAGLITFFLMAYIFPKILKLPEGYHTAGQSKEDLEFEFGSEFKKAEAKGYGLGVVLAALWCGGIWLWMSRVMATPAPAGTTFFSQPNSTTWYLPMFFGAMGCVAVGAVWLTERFAGPDAELYERLQNLKSNFRIKPLFTTLLGIFSVFCAFMLALVADCRTVATAKGMTLNPFFSLGATERSWSDVERLIYAKSVKAPNGNIVPKNLWQIRFKGGDVWSSDHAPGEHADSEYSQLMALASKQSKVKPEAFRLLQDADPR